MSHTYLVVLELSSNTLREAKRLYPSYFWSELDFQLIFTKTNLDLIATSSKKEKNEAGLVR